MANWTWYPSGGDWTYIDSICKLYEAKGHKIIPFAVHNEKNYPTPFSKYFLAGIDYKAFYKKMTFLSGINLLAKTIYSTEAKRKLKDLLSENHIDLAQLNNINNYHTPSIIPVLKKAKIPIVWRILDFKLICPNNTFLSKDKVCEACYKHKYYECVLNKCKKNSLLASALMALESYVYHILPYYKQVDMYLFQSEFTRDLFVKYGWDVKKTKIIENTYDGSLIRPAHEGKNYILYFGRISKEKGIYTLLNAMKALPDVELKIVGDGPELDNYVNYVSGKSMTNVSFLGPKWGKDLEPIIQGCEFVVVPSEWYEPSPYVVLQSFAHGKPVIAASIGGLKDMIVHGENGLLFKTGDAAGLSRAIAGLLPDKKLISKMGANARQILESKYNSEKYYTTSMNMFTTLVNSGRNA
jgi:glycosyltransferase involved in cell wall biosynthesis